MAAAWLPVLVLAVATCLAGALEVPPALPPYRQPLQPLEQLSPLGLRSAALSSSGQGHDPYPPKLHARTGVHYPHPTSTGPSPDHQTSPDQFNGMFQLLLLSAVATAGTMGSIFVISAMTVIDTFQVRGNSFLASFALGHLLVTVLVVPSMCVAIMAGIPLNQPNLCHYQWLITEATLLISVLSLTFMALENFKGLRSIVTYDLCCTKLRIVTIVLLIWAIAIGVVIGQEVNGYGPNFCEHERGLPVWVSYHTTVAISLILIPTLISIYYFTRAVFCVKNYRMQLNENPQTQIYFQTDEGILNSNAAVYAAFLFMWAPLCIVAAISTHEPVSQQVADWCWWLALANSCFYSYLYAFTNRDMGETFVKLLYYCCCKSHVSFIRKGPGFNSGLRNASAAQAHSGLMGSGAGAGGGLHGSHPLMGHGPRHGGMGGYGMVTLSSGGVMGGGPFRAFRSNRMSSDL